MKLYKESNNSLVLKLLILLVRIIAYAYYRNKAEQLTIGINSYNNLLK